MISTDRLQDQDLMARRDLTREDLLAYIDSFPALLWRIEIARSRIEFLTRRQLPFLGAKTGLFMKSAAFRAGVVLPEDMRYVESFMGAIARGENSEAIVRVPHASGGVHWLKLAGWMLPGDQRYYMGYLMDVSGRANEIRCIIEREADLLLMLELSESPVALFDLATGRVLAQNEAACRLFGHPAEEFRNLSLSDLHHPGMAATFRKLLGEIALLKVWEGRALFRRSDRTAFAAAARVRVLDYRGQELLRVSWTQVEVEERAPRLPQRPAGLDQAAERLSRELPERLAGVTDMERILGTFLDAQLPSIRYDAILFSDIYAKKNRVFVYWAGEPFHTMPQGEMFSYEGTIAQDIERFRLDSLIVEDTLDSIKAIDWALFIPKGVRSYFAKPFFQRGALRAVLILCSLKPRQFPAEGLPEYELLFDPFRRAIQAWRSAQRRGPDAG